MSICIRIFVTILKSNIKKKGVGSVGTNPKNVGSVTGSVDTNPKVLYERFLEKI